LEGRDYLTSSELWACADVYLFQMVWCAPGKIS
jgi:hypothetical protein